MDADDTQEQLDLLHKQIATLFRTVDRLVRSVDELQQARGTAWYKIVRGTWEDGSLRSTWAIEAWKNGKLLGTDGGGWVNVEYAREMCTKYLTGMDIHPAVGSFTVKVP